MAEGNVAADELRLLIERIERLEEEKKAIADDVKDVYAEGKARGYDTKTMRAIVRLRKMETRRARSRTPCSRPTAPRWGSTDGDRVHPATTRRFGPPADWVPEVHGECGTTLRRRCRRRRRAAVHGEPVAAERG
jgi:uncharacterized protein (UPF0335 family)